MRRDCDNPACFDMGRDCPICGGYGHYFEDDPASGGGCLGWLIGKLVLAGLAVLGIAVVGWFVTGRTERPGVLGAGASETSWSGTYICTGGELGLTLELQVAAGAPGAARPASAIFTYHPTPGSEDITHVSTALGTLTGEDLALIRGGDDAEMPLEIDGVNGVVGEDADGILGTVESAGCESFGLTLDSP